MVLLDPLAPSQILLGGAVDLSEERVHQQAVCDETTGEWYLTQVVDGGRLLPGEFVAPTAAQRSARGDMAITKLSPSGDQLGTMYCRRFDHGGGLGLDYDYGGPMLWTAYDAAEVPSGQNAHGSKIGRFPFQPGATIDVGDPSVQVFDPFPGARAVLPALDLSNNRIAINYAIVGEQRRYRVWDLDEFKAGNFPAYIADFDWAEEEQFQSFALHDEYVYQTHGRAYSGTNPVPGDAFFAIIDIFTGRTVRIAANYEHPELVYREPESITVLAGDPAGAQLVYGFATGPVPRQASLFATEAGAGPGTWVSSTIVDGQGIAITASVEDRTGLRTWRIVRRPDGAVLFTGSGAEFPAGVAEMIDTRPPVCTSLIYNLILDYEDREELHETRALTWVPPGGCGTGVGPIVDAPDTLSCAEAYTARIHWRGGALVKPVEIMDYVTEVTWSRTLNDVSTAEVTLSKISESCCRDLQDVHDWVHELSIYREVRGTPQLVWQGPIQVIRIQRETVVIEAADVFAWLDRLVNTYRVTYTSAAPIRGNRRRGTIVYMAHNHLRLNLLESSLSVPPDYPEIMDYVVAREDGLPVISVEKDGSPDPETGRQDAIWTEYLGDIFREWIKRGLTWTTVGRSLVFRGFANQQTLPITRMDMNDFMGDVEVIRDGTNTATYGFATNQDTQDIREGFTVGWGYSGTAYGRLDSLVRVNEEYNSEAEAQTELRQAARREIAGRYPTPLVIRVPDNAQISPDAPITMDMLVPGERVDVYGDTFCIDVAQGFGIADVEGRWSNGREQISIGLVPLDDLSDGSDVDPDDPTAP